MTHKEAIGVVAAVLAENKIRMKEGELDFVEHLLLFHVAPSLPGRVIGEIESRLLSLGGELEDWAIAVGPAGYITVVLGVKVNDGISE